MRTARSRPSPRPFCCWSPHRGSPLPAERCPTGSRLAAWPSRRGQIRSPPHPWTATCWCRAGVQVVRGDSTRAPVLTLSSVTTSRSRRRASPASSRRSLLQPTWSCCPPTPCPSSTSPASSPWSSHPARPAASCPRRSCDGSPRPPSPAARPWTSTGSSPSTPTRRAPACTPPSHDRCPVVDRVPGLPAHRPELGAPAHVRRLRPRRVLRLLPDAPRGRARTHRRRTTR